MIDGVVVKDITRYPDERGFFNEILRFKDYTFFPQQASHGMRIAGVSNGWHIHQHLSEVFYVVTGSLRLVLKDCRTGSGVKTEFAYREPQKVFSVIYGQSSTPHEYMEIVMGEYTPRAVLIPHGVAHGYRILSGPCHVIYFASQAYDMSRNDEGRIEQDRWPGHDWTKGT